MVVHAAGIHYDGGRRLEQLLSRNDAYLCKGAYLQVLNMHVLQIERG
jgi:hypothetical protein